MVLLASFNGPSDARCWFALLASATVAIFIGWKVRSALAGFLVGGVVAAFVAFIVLGCVKGDMVGLMTAILSAIFSGIGALGACCSGAISERIWIDQLLRDDDDYAANLAAQEAPQQAIDELLRLCEEIDENYTKFSHDDAQAAQKTIEVDIKRIGQQLFDLGGEPLMLRVHGEIARRSRNGRYLEGVWDRIGTWLG